MNMYRGELEREIPALCLFDDGKEVKTPFGTYYIIEKELALEDDITNAQIPIPEGDNHRRITGIITEERPALHSLDEMMFLDIESTGLQPRQPLFLVGLLFRRDGQYILKQYLARRPAEEKALLSGIAEAVRGFQSVVTYNGKNFDIPYIETRMAKYNLPYCLPQFHIDLLWFARRHYRAHLPNCRLATLEEHVLNMRRVGDIPGHRIPEAYNRFVKTQDPGKMLDILEHNTLDLISLRKLLFLAG